MDLSYKIILDKRRTKPNGIYRLKVRVFQNGITKEQSLDIYVHEKDWDEQEQIILSTNKNYKTNNFKLNTAKTKLERTVLLHESNATLTPEILLGSLNPTEVKTSSTSFKEYADELIKELITAKRAGTAMAYTDATNSLINYGGKQLTLKQVNYTFLDKYNTHMLAKGVKVNSIAAYLRSIRAIYNKAIKAGIASIQDYPFSKFRIETEDTFNRTLSINEMQRFVSIPLKENTPIWHNRNFFILSFCLVGINYTDLFTLTPEQHIKSVIHYRRDKTGKLYSIGIVPIVQELLDYYEQLPSRNGGTYLLPQLQLTNDVMQHKKWVKQLCQNSNKQLKQIANRCGIDIEVTTYYARYTWANIAKKLGYTKDFIAEALGHEYGNKVTGIYLDRYESEKIDEANRKVIEAIF
ncbi:MAG: site-specific integrase [Flavipsychrobacter sp.]|nr:site-specific integrase [Flavipsychrobacter sp.]